jgi:hypothetical protein
MLDVSSDKEMIFSKSSILVGISALLQTFHTSTPAVRLSDNTSLMHANHNQKRSIELQVRVTECPNGFG